MSFLFSICRTFFLRFLPLAWLRALEAASSLRRQKTQPRPFPPFPPSWSGIATKTFGSPQQSHGTCPLKLSFLIFKKMLSVQGTLPLFVDGLEVHTPYQTQRPWQSAVKNTYVIRTCTDRFLCIKNGGKKRPDPAALTSLPAKLLVRPEARTSGV